MTEHDDVEKLLASVVPRGAPLELRDRVLNRITADNPSPDNPSPDREGVGQTVDVEARSLTVGARIADVPSPGAARAFSRRAGESRKH